MDFAIRIFGRINFSDGIGINITDTTISTWVVMAILLIFAIIVRVQSRKWDAYKKPTGLQNILELAVDAFEGLYKGNAGTKMSFLTPWFFSLFAFIIFSNIIGLFGIRPPTADWGMTFPLAVTSFILIQYSGFRYRPKEYLKGLCQPIILFLPLNIMGELARPVSLSFRLMGNILGGVVLLSLLYGLAPVLANPAGFVYEAVHTAVFLWGLELRNLTRLQAEWFRPRLLSTSQAPLLLRLYC